MKGHLQAGCLLSAVLSISPLSHADLKQGIAYYKAGDEKHGVPALLPYAKAGNIEAQFDVSMLLLFKFGKTFKDIDDAKHWMFASANGGNPYAMWHLGKKTFCPFYFGMKCDTSKWQAKAITRWKQLAKQGDGNAVAMLAEHDAGIEQYIPGLNSYEYKKQMKKAAEMGSGYATMEYYKLFEDHKINKIEKKTIKSDLVKAANTGYLPAMYVLGNGSTVHFSGKGQAFKWSKKCADAGYTGCIGSMYFNYLNGYGVSRNLEQAYKWGLVSKQFGILGASEDMRMGKGAKLLSTLTSSQKAQAKEEADAFVATHLPNYGANPMNP